jgi:peptide/nickel transport system substrate-binding protein
LKHLSLLVFAAAGLLPLILCASTLAAEDKKVDILTIADSTGDWGFPSPYGHYSKGPGYLRMSLIFDTLVWKNQTGFVPALAERWEYLPNEMAYVFHLREGVTWNDGEPFTANDVVFTVEYTKEHPYLFADTTKVDKTQALDDRTIKIYLTKNYAPFLDQVAGTLPIMPEHIYRDVSDPENFKDNKALTGTGPFKLVNYDRAQGTYLYESNENYYQGSPQVKQLKFIVVSSEMAAASLRKGDVDAASVPPEVVEDLKKEGFAILESHSSVIKTVINYKKEPFSDVRFRQALYYAIDRQALVETALRGYGVVASAGLIAPDDSWYNPGVEAYSYDPAKTEEILKEMGYSRVGQYFSKNNETLTIELLVSPARERTGELMAQQMDEAGIKVNMRSVDAKTLNSLVNDWKFDLAMNDHAVTVERLNKMTKYDQDPQLTKLMEYQVSEMDPAKRKELVYQEQEIIAKDLPSLPLYFLGSYWASNSKVSFYSTYNGVGEGMPTNAFNKMVFV